MSFTDKINLFFERTFNNNCFNNVYGTSRSILALGTLITLVFSSPKILFDKDLFNINNSGLILDKINIFYVFGYENLYISYAISIIILLIVFSGFYPRITGVLHWIIAFSFQNASSLPDGGDQVAMILSFYLIPLTILDNRKNHFYQTIFQTPFQNSVSVLITKLLIPVQFSIIYLHSAMEKLYKVEEWRNGTAIYYILNDPLFGSSILSNSLLSNRYIIVPMTWGVIFLEILLFTAFFMPYKKRKPLLYLGVLFHLSIILFLGLFSFFCSMVSGLIIYLLNPSNSINYLRVRNFLENKRQV